MQAIDSAVDTALNPAYCTAIVIAECSADKTTQCYPNSTAQLAAISAAFCSTFEFTKHAAYYATEFSAKFTAVDVPFKSTDDATNESSIYSA